MPLVALRNVSIAFGGPAVLDRASLGIDRGERVCLLGRNGAGKSTLMSLIDRTLLPDDGDVVWQTGLTVARLEQEVPDDVEGTTFDVVAAGLGATGDLLARYHAASHRVATEQSDAALRELDRLHHDLDVAGAWESQTRVDTCCSTSVSRPTRRSRARRAGGSARRCSPARSCASRSAAARRADEPSRRGRDRMDGGVPRRPRDDAAVRHARPRVPATRRDAHRRAGSRTTGGLGPDYDRYVERKAAALDAESKQWAEFDRTLAKRKSGSARASRRVARATRDGCAPSRRCAWSGAVGASAWQRAAAGAGAERSGRLVVEARDVGFSRGDRAIVRDLTTTIMRGDRVGLIGPNGSGKTTLLRLLLGELPPDTGSIRMGTGLEIAYFDQLREQLDPERSVFDSVADGAEFVQVGDARRHVHGYLEDFLFRPERARTPVGALSGGERNRLLLARPVHAAVQPARDGRADERSRPRDARPARGAARRVLGDAAAREPRPRVPRQHGDEHARVRRTRPDR
jgi:ATP-binding cassette subfamily F protein uup